MVGAPESIRSAGREHCDALITGFMRIFTNEITFLFISVGFRSRYLNISQFIADFRIGPATRKSL
jgi:hypothetical protein